MRRQADLTKLVKSFTEKLRARRKALGLTQEQLADVSGFSTNYIARLELGTSVPSLSTLTRLSKALRIGIPELLQNEIEPVSSADVCSALLLPLSDEEAAYALTQLRTTVDFLVTIRHRATEGK